MQVIRSVAVLLLILLARDAVFAQALTNLSSVRVGYNTRKATVKPEGELKAQLDKLESEIAAATRLGRNGEVRRLFAKGVALLAGRPWAGADEFQAALVIRTDRMLVDSSTPYRVRLEQIFQPAIELTRPLSARVSIRPRMAPPVGGNPTAGRSGGAPPTPPPATDLGTFAGVSRDLRESPFPIDLNLSTLADGAYTLSVEVRDQETVLATSTLGVAVQKGLDTRLKALDAAALKAPASIQNDLRFPADYVRKINQGVIGIGTFDLAADVAAAEAVAATFAKTKKDPFVGRTGDFERHYLLEPANEIMPYRVYVPKAYSASKTYPLIIALHGLGGTEDGFFDNYARRVPALAEERGYIVAAPLGFRVDGFYGSGVAANAADTAATRDRTMSEQDVMEVLKRMRSEYKIDDTRIFLMGHSMGGIGTWAIAAKYPDIWAAIAPFSGTGSPAIIERIKHIPEFVVHGDADPTVPVSGSRNMVAEMKKLGVDVTYVEVPGGNHTAPVVPNLPGMFDFFDKHKKKTSTPTTQQ